MALPPLHPHVRLEGVAIAPVSLDGGPALSHCARQLLFSRKPSWAAPRVHCRIFPSLAPALRAHQNKSTYVALPHFQELREVPSLTTPFVLQVED